MLHPTAARDAPFLVKDGWDRDSLNCSLLCIYQDSHELHFLDDVTFTCHSPLLFLWFFLGVLIISADSHLRDADCFPVCTIACSVDPEVVLVVCFVQPAATKHNSTACQPKEPRPCTAHHLTSRVCHACCFGPSLTAVFRDNLCVR